MKKLLINFCVVVVLSTSVMVNTGCVSTPAAITYKTLGGTITSVDTAMKVWADSYVKRRRVAKTDADFAKLDNEYNLVNLAKLKYNTSLEVAFGAIEQAYAANPNAVTPPDINFTAGNLLTILSQIKH